jgi:hypothetical protein
MGVNPVSILSKILMDTKGITNKLGTPSTTAIGLLSKTTPIVAHFLSLVNGRKRVDSLMKHRSNPMCMLSKILT